MGGFCSVVSILVFFREAADVVPDARGLRTDFSLVEASLEVAGSFGLVVLGLRGFLVGGAWSLRAVAGPAPIVPPKEEPCRLCPSCFC